MAYENNTSVFSMELNLPRRLSHLNEFGGWANHFFVFANTAYFILLREGHVLAFDTVGC